MRCQKQAQVIANYKYALENRNLFVHFGDGDKTLTSKQGVWFSSKPHETTAIYKHESHAHGNFHAERAMSQ